MGYTKEVIKGISWMGALRFVTRVISFLRTAIIARILTPSQFGVFSIVSIIYSIADILTETGINIFLIQKQENLDEYIDTAWFVSIVRGGGIALIILAFIPVTDHLYGLGDIATLLKYISIVPAIRGFINPSVAKFLKELHFHKEFFYRTSIFFVESAGSVLFVLLLHSPMALVLGIIGGAIYEVGVSFLIVKPVPRLQFNLMHFKEVINHGKWLTASGIFNYLYHNADNLIVGKLLGTQALGLYDMSYKISTLPISEVGEVISKATFPVFVKMSYDSNRLKKAYFKSLSLITVISLCAGFVFFFFPEIIIRIVLGPQWVQAAPVLRTLSIFGVIRAISISVIAPVYALHKHHMITAVTALSMGCMLGSIVPFIHFYGLQGAAYAALLGALAPLPLILYFVNTIFSKRT